MMVFGDMQRIRLPTFGGRTREWNVFVSRLQTGLGRGGNSPRISL